MTHFSDLGLAEPILHALTAEGYQNPTPIQAQVIPAMIAGQDILGIAQTGTGKTAAFVLPILHALSLEKTGNSKERVERRPRTCKALIVVPTRELAQQIAIGVKTYGRHLRPSVAVVVGGASISMQSKALAQGVDVLVATPGRLEDHMRSGTVKLSGTTTVVLDEADQMLDMGFIPAIRRILGAVADQHQTMLLSATMPRPLAALAKDFMNDPQTISVAPQSKPIDRIEQSVLHLSAGDKKEMLLDLLAPLEVERAIVFTRTKHGADKVAKYLDGYGLPGAVIHGNKSQAQRERALQAFRKGKMKVMIATDVAARGIDIDDVSHVVNYEMPNVPEAYVHRIGRTARAGKSGIAISLCDPSERKHLKAIERLIKQTIPVLTDVPSTVKVKIERPAPQLHTQEEPAKGKKDRKSKKRRQDGPRESARRDDFGFDPLSPQEVQAEGRKARRPRRERDDAFQADNSNDKPARFDRNKDGKDGGKRGDKPFAKAGGAPSGKAGGSRGDVKWFNASKGYGFLSQDGGGPDVFVHITDMEKAGIAKPSEGQRFHYELAEVKRGKFSAVNLRAA